MSEPTGSPSGCADSATGAPPVIAAAATSRWGRWLWVLMAGLFVALLVVLFCFNPANHSFYPFCAFHRLTGLQCPGCGGLRAAHQMLHGHVVTAFRYNPLVVLAAPVVAFVALRRLWRGPQKEKVSHRRQARWAWFAFTVLVVFWIVRNLPFDLFKLPSG